MAYFLFVDESGNDGSPPYQVLAGVAVRDSRLWSLITRLQEEELSQFGCRYTAGTRELKAKKILNAKTFRLAGQSPAIPLPARAALAARALQDGASVTRSELTALAQSKLAYASRVLDIAFEEESSAFACAVVQACPTPDPNALRKDYNYLLERFFYRLEDAGAEDQGVIVCDELEKSRCCILIGQFGSYFKRTQKGQSRCSRIIPEPFFVHSDLTTGIQVVDLVAYVISWGLRFVPAMVEPIRAELTDYASQVERLEYHSQPRLQTGVLRRVHSFKYIDDLRSARERRRP
jgi:hypothetical protein